MCCSFCLCSFIQAQFSHLALCCVFLHHSLYHETFGDVKKLVMQEFVKQAYLELTKLPNNEQPVFEVRWGQRAKLETSKLQILKFVSLVTMFSSPLILCLCLSLSVILSSLFIVTFVPPLLSLLLGKKLRNCVMIIDITFMVDFVC